MMISNTPTISLTTLSGKPLLIYRENGVTYLKIEDICRLFVRKNSHGTIQKLRENIKSISNLNNIDSNQVYRTFPSGMDFVKTKESLTATFVSSAVVRDLIWSFHRHTFKKKCSIQTELDNILVSTIEDGEEVLLSGRLLGSFATKDPVYIVKKRKNKKTK